MKILTCSLMHGGGSRIDRIKDALEPYDADVLVLSEFRNNPQGADLRGWLKAQGYRHQAAPEGPPGLNTVLVAARHPFEAETFPERMSDPELGDFWQSVLLARFDSLNVFGLYMPGEDRKQPVFDFLLDLPERYLEEDSILIGEMNTGRHYEDEAGKTFASAHQLDALLGKGWVDAWRTRHPEVREFTWYSKPWNNGFRLDHALVSPSLDARITEVMYSHAEREARVTDHSIMLVEYG